jgi:hypothetical protein
MITWIDRAVAVTMVCAGFMGLAVGAIMIACFLGVLPFGGCP